MLGFRCEYLNHSSPRFIVAPDVKFCVNPMIGVSDGRLHGMKGVVTLWKELNGRAGLQWRRCRTYGEIDEAAGEGGERLKPWGNACFVLAIKEF